MGGDCCSPACWRQAAIEEVLKASRRKVWRYEVPVHPRPVSATMASHQELVQQVARRRYGQDSPYPGLGRKNCLQGLLGVPNLKCPAQFIPVVGWIIDFGAVMRSCSWTPMWGAKICGWFAQNCVTPGQATSRNSEWEYGTQYTSHTNSLLAGDVTTVVPR